MNELFLLCKLKPCQELTPHALYMRLKRLCQKTPAGKLNVDESIHEQWISGNRDTLLLALVRSMKSCGMDSSHRTRQAVRDRFFKKCFAHGSMQVSRLSSKNYLGIIVVQLELFI